MKQKIQSQEGQILIIAIVFFAILLTMSAALMGYIVLHVRSEKNAIAGNQALRIAEGGIDKAVYQLNQDSTYSGETNTSLGNGTFTVSLATIDGSTKRITATGYVPNSTNPVATKIVKATVYVSSVAISFHYGVQIGNGGLTMNNGSQINGNVFSNGNISGTGVITGDATAAIGTQPTADQQDTAQSGGFTFADTNARSDIAQSFTPAASSTLNQLSLYMKKTGSPGDLTVKIMTDSSGTPTKVQVGGDGTLSSSLITNTYGWVNIGFVTSPSLTAGTKYWIILISNPINGSSYTWGLDTSDSYANNTGKYSANWNVGNPTWTNVGGDLDFKAYMGGNPNTITSVTVNGTARAEKLQGCTVGVDAYYLNVNTCTVTGTTHPNTTPDAPQPMPISDAQMQQWENTASSGGTIPGPYTLNGTQSLGPVKVDGDLTVNGILYLTGPIWVNGDLYFANNSSLIVAGSVGNNGAVIIADATGNQANKGITTLSNNMTIAGNGNPNSFPMVITTNSSSNAMTMSNNGSSVVLYASAGTINMVNNASANQVTAYALSLANNTTVNYVSGLQNAGFSNGPGGSWVFVPGSYVIVK